MKANGLEPLRVSGNVRITRPPRGWRWLKRLGAWLLGLIVVLIVAGSIYQALGARSDAAAYPAPGRVLDIGGYDLHLNCTGEAAGDRPTVILETLSGGTSANWAWIQPALAAQYRVCSYDRAGRGWSQPGVDSRDLWGSVADLEGLLRAGGITGPLVLVGHSIGGQYVRGFAQANPDEVVGVVLLDSSHPDQYELHPGYERDAETYLQMAKFFPTVARIGLFRLFFATGGEIDFASLPERQHAEVASFWSSAAYHHSQVSETRMAPTILSQAKMAPDFGDTPLLVISAGTNNPDGWSELQRDLATQSTDSEHVTLTEATHVSLAFDRTHAAQVSELIASFAQRANAR